MLIKINGELMDGVTSKDIILHVIGIIGTAGGTGYTIEFGGSAIQSLSMEARMSISNMAIEAGARAGLIAPDEVTFEYLKGRPMCPTGDEWDKAVEYWKSLVSDEGADFDKTIEIDAKDIAPTVTWGTSPQDVAPVTGTVPMINAEGNDEARRVCFFSFRIILFFLALICWTYEFFFLCCSGWYQAFSRVHWSRGGSKTRGRPTYKGIHWILHQWKN